MFNSMRESHSRGGFSVYFVRKIGITICDVNTYRRISRVFRAKFFIYVANSHRLMDGVKSQNKQLIKDSTIKLSTNY